MKILLLDVPVIHAGYIKLFDKYSYQVDQLAILDKDLLERFGFVENKVKGWQPEIRALEPNTANLLITGAGWFRFVRLVSIRHMEDYQSAEIITVNEAIMRHLIAQYFPHNKVIYESVFLRWDEASVYSNSNVNYDRISKDVFDQRIMETLGELKQQSSDWWRQVGAGIVKDQQLIITSYNHHLPTDQTVYLEGDPRDYVKAGQDSHLSTAIHAEQAVIAQAAKQGISLDGGSIYVTVFPCPVCAKLIAWSGIKKCYFSSGHASLDGETVLKSHGVEIILVM
ncbi:MAG: deaminase [bacterium]